MIKEVGWRGIDERMEVRLGEGAKENKEALGKLYDMITHQLFGIIFYNNVDAIR